MHVLYFHQHFSTREGSSGTRSYEMAQALLREGHTVTMVCGSHDQGATGLTEPFKGGRRRGLSHGVDVIEFDLSYGNHMGVLKRAIVFLKFAMRSVSVAMTERADVVFATSTPLTAGIPGIFAKWLRRKPFVFEVRDLWPELPRAVGAIRNPVVLWLMSALEWMSYRSADKLIGLSPGIVDGVARRGVAREKIALVPNGCDLELFAAPDGTWRPAEVGEDRLFVIFSGTHGPANGLDAVLDAAAHVKALGRDDVRIVFIGNGKEKPRLRQRAKDEKIDNVLFLDAVPKTKLPSLMAGADLGLQVLRNVPGFYFGTSPNKFFDYIAAGVPTLNNYPGWLAEMIVENDCGFVVPPEDTRAFAQALIAAADDRAALKRMGRNARALAESRFDRKILSRQWVEWVLSVAKK